jgi:uncharacterized membrane protein YozB (DUF420 family)
VLSACISEQGEAELSDIGRRDRVFYLAMGLLVLAVVVYGFGRSFYFAPFMPVRQIRPLLQLHAAVFSAWVLLFILQTSLISAQRRDLHRRAGIAGAFLAGLLVIVGGLTVLESVRLQRLQDGAVNLFGSATQLAVFAILAAAGLLLRKRAELHKRLMLVGTLALAQAGLGRILPGLNLGPGGQIVVTMLFMFSWLIYDLLTHRRPLLAPLFGAAAVVLIAPVGIPLIVRSTAWLQFTAWVQS